jgi:adenosyl cobinamide kinase/adenosyl cobinamide phosphate guanylyltransferase
LWLRYLERRYAEGYQTPRTPRRFKLIGRNEKFKSELVIIDCITLLVNKLFSQFEESQFDNIADDVLLENVTTEISGLLKHLSKSTASFIIVSNEVGLGLVPANRMGRIYRDCLGRANQMLAQAADEVFWRVFPENKTLSLCLCRGMSWAFLI